MSILKALANFNPRLREGGDNTGFLFLPGLTYFNPRLREGGDDEDACEEYIADISIHASAREATAFCSIMTDIPVISIHASAREATSAQLFFEVVPGHFNPRLREGGDDRLHQNSGRSSNFNPRLREGGDIAARFICK